MNKNLRNVTAFFCGVIAILLIGAGISAWMSQKGIWVDPSGSDTTGSRNHQDRPFKTLTAAKNAALAGDTIYVLAGLYNETDLLKNLVNWHFYVGATNFYTGQSAIGMFDDNANSITSMISGAGTFIYASSNQSSPPNTGVLVTQNTNTVVHMDADTMLAGSLDPNVFIFSGNVSTIWAVDCREVIVNANTIGVLPDLGSQEVYAIYWTHGNTTVRAHNIITTLGACIGGAEDLQHPFGETSLYVFADEIRGSAAVTYYADLDQGRIWVFANQIKCTGVAIDFFDVAGKLYINTQKISTTASNAVPLIRFNTVGASLGKVWLTAEKMTGGGGYVEMPTGNLELTVGQYEDLGTVTNTAFRNTGGKLILNGGNATILNGRGILHSGGTTLVKGMHFYSSNNVVAHVTAAGFSTEGGAFYSKSTSNAVYATTSQTVTNLGTFFNTAPSSVITFGTGLNLYIPTFTVTDSGGITLATNSTAPNNTSIIRVWVTVTNNGAVFKMPLYQ